MMTIDEALTIVTMLDTLWQDVPLREETITGWANELSQPNEFYTFENALTAVKLLLLTNERRPSFAEIYAAARSQAKAAREHREANAARIAIEQRLGGMPYLLT